MFEKYLFHSFYKNLKQIIEYLSKNKSFTKFFKI
jgi:hypothetical protein